MYCIIWLGLNLFKLLFHQTLKRDGVGRLLVVEQPYVKLIYVSIVFCFIEFHVVLLHEQVLWLILLIAFLCRISFLFDRFYDSKKIKDFVRIGSLFCIMFFLPFDPCYSMYTLFLFFWCVLWTSLLIKKNRYLIHWHTYYNEWCRVNSLIYYFGH